MGTKLALTLLYLLSPIEKVKVKSQDDSWHYDGTRSPPIEHDGYSPYTAMVFVSCKMAFPAETCTVMVFMPSEVNLNDILPSKVMRG